jgi:hypothetical protein
MSTKTTFKRVALVTVAALGFGMTSAVVPANADQALSFALNTSSITVVGDSATGGAVFAITVTSDTPTVGFSQGETITASVVGVPDGTASTKKSLASNSTDLMFTEVKQSGVTQVNPRWDAVLVDTATGGSAYDGAIGFGNTAHYGMNSNLTAAESETARLLKSRTYYIEVRIKNNAVAAVIDQGVYTIQFDLTNAATATIQRSTAKVDWVTAAANSGAVVTAASAGQWFLGETPTIANQTSTKYMSATLRNRDGGAIRTSAGQSPALSASLTDASTSPVTITMSSSDRGGNTLERAFSTTVATQFPDDGNYSVYNSTWLSIAEADPVLTVRYGLASATATVAIAAAATTGTAGVGSIVGAGQVDSTDAATLPLTTKAVAVNYTVKVGTTPQTGYKVYYTLAYGTSCVAGDMLPVKATTPTAITTDSLGVASVAITNAYPLDGCTATVTFSGAVTNDAAQVVTWSKTKAATALPNPGGSYKAVLKSAQSVTWTILDSFGAIMPGATVTVSHTGANAPTVAPAARASDAKGQVTYTWTDALATATTTDVVSIATVNAVAPTTSAGSITVSYVATLPVVASIKAYYAATTALVGTNPILVPTTVIPGVAATTYRLTSGADQVDITKAVTGASAEHFVALKFQNTDAADAAVTGVPMTVTATNGHILGADGIPTTTRTLYANEAFYVVGTKTGLATYTATTGTNTAKATIMWVNIHTDARVLKATESNGTVTATVTDHMGNVVSGVTVSASLTAGTGRLGNGATYNTYVTASDGTVSFDVTGAATVAVKLSTTTYAKSTWLAGYGDATGTLITTGAPAGVSSVSLTTAGNTVVADSAQTAADAAAEATDAANAATDAANAAAEAADAATAAAQDAADAVAALSAQVASLISGLKSQLTALTNLVIKIQKKVKA